MADDVPAALRQRFIGGLAGRWQAISQPASPQDCRQALHRLAGAAGSYGFAALGQAARQAEHSCTGSASGLPDPAALAELQRCLVQAGLPADDTTR
ncbi:MAG: Hpt domain-containing protein [Burkholderiaceae bacterium]|nr:Hpt domain-containing protein [Burkholderiaceae bacterium]